MENDLFLQEQQETLEEVLFSVTNDTTLEVDTHIFPTTASTSSNSQGMSTFAKIVLSQLTDRPYANKFLQAFIKESFMISNYR